MVINSLNINRPEFLAPSSDFGPSRETHHTVKAQADDIADQIRIEKGILARLPPLLQREQALRVQVLESMHKQALDHAYFLFKQDRSQ